MINNDLERLRSSLEYFGANVSRAAQSAQKVDISAAQQFLQRYQQQHGSNATNRLVLSGQYPGSNVATMAAGANQTVGQNLFNTFQQTVREEVATNQFPLTRPDGGPVDLEGTINQRYTAIMQQNAGVFGPLGTRNPNHVAAQAGFNAGMDGLRAELVAKQREAVLAGTRQMANNVAMAALDRVITSAEGEQDPAKLRDYWQRTRQEVLDWATPGGPGDGRRSILDHNQLDELMIGRLKAAATRSPGAVLAILRLDRGTSAEGVQLGTLAQRRHADADQILQLANDTLDKQQVVQVREEAINKAVAALQRNDGSFLNLRPVEVSRPYNLNDRFIRMSVEEQQQAALQRYEATQAERLRAQGVPEGTADEIMWRENVNTYIGHDRPNHQWRDTLNVHGRILSNSVNLSTQQGQDQAIRAVNLYERIARTNPGYAETTLGISVDARRFYDQVITYRDLLGYDPAAAVQAAAGAARTPQASPGRDERETLRSEAARVGTTMFGWMGGGVNRRAAERAVERVAETLMTSDIDAKTAIQSAARIVDQRAGVVNGFLVLGSTYVHRGTQDTVVRRLGEIQQQYAGRLTGLSGPYAGKLTIVPEDNRSSFRVVQAEGPNAGEPVVAAVPIVGADGSPQLGSDGKPQYRPQMLRILGPEIEQMHRSSREAERADRDAERTNAQRISTLDAQLNGPPRTIREIFAGPREQGPAGPERRPGTAAEEAEASRAVAAQRLSRQGGGLVRPADNGAQAVPGSAALEEELAMREGRAYRNPDTAGTGAEEARGARETAVTRTNRRRRHQAQ